MVFMHGATMDHRMFNAGHNANQDNSQFFNQLLSGWLGERVLHQA